MTNNSLAIVAAKALPALSSSTLTYNPERNVFLTLHYTCLDGNNYYRAIRLSDGLVVFFQIGEGYAYTFLNGITLLWWEAQKAKFIAQNTGGKTTTGRAFQLSSRRNRASSCQKNTCHVRQNCLRPKSASYRCYHSHRR